MQPDVICRAEDLPFADGSFDVVACRDRGASLRRSGGAVGSWRASHGELVLVEDNALLRATTVEEAERLRDPTHVRNYTEDEWRGSSAAPACEVEVVELEEKRSRLEPWLERSGCTGDEAARVRELLADRTRDGKLPLDRGIIIKGRKAGG